VHSLPAHAVETIPPEAVVLFREFLVSSSNSSGQATAAHAAACGCTRGSSQQQRVDTPLIPCLIPVPESGLMHCSSKGQPCPWCSDKQCHSCCSHPFPCCVWAVVLVLQDQIAALGPWGGALFVLTVMCAEMVPLFPTQPLTLASGLLFGPVKVRQA
jgi:hypothetical protein